MTRTKFNVLSVLSSVPTSRDNDAVLYSEVWSREKKDWKTDTDIINGILSKKLSDPQTIGRCRRHLQEHNENLRGHLYTKRHNLAKTYTQQLEFNL